MSHSKQPVYTPKNVEHGLSSRKKEKVNVILKNTIGPQEQIRKVRIPVDTPVQQLKEKIAELYDLNPSDFELTHIPSQGKNSATNPDEINIKSKKPTKILSDIVRHDDSTDKHAVKIIVKDRSGIKRFQKKVKIPDNITIGELRRKVAEKFGVENDEFHISLERYIQN